MEDHCIFCGGYVPEGRQVCLECEKKLTQNKDIVETILIKKPKHKRKGKATRIGDRSRFGIAPNSMEK